MKLALDKTGIELHGAPRRTVVDAADDAVVMHQLVKHVARQHPLGTIGYGQLPLQFGTLGENQPRHPVGRPHRRSRFDDEQIVLLEQRNDRARGRLDVRHVGLVISLERSRHDHDIDIAGHRLERRAQTPGRHGFADRLGQAGLDDMNLAPVHLPDNRRIDVHADHFQASRSGESRRRKTDVSQSQKQNALHSFRSFAPAPETALSSPFARCAVKLLKISSRRAVLPSICRRRSP